MSIIGYLRSRIWKSRNSPMDSPRPGKTSSINIAMWLIFCRSRMGSCMSGTIYCRTSGRGIVDVEAVSLTVGVELVVSVEDAVG